jgi:hypothetical protein
MPGEKVRRFCDLLAECAAVRYAPVGLGQGNIAEWGQEMRMLLKESGQ